MKRIAVFAVTAATLAAFARPAGAVDATVIERPASGSLQGAVAPAPVRYSGTAPENSTVDVFESGTDALVGTTQANEYGRWVLDSPMSDGEHTVYAVSREPGATPSNITTFTVDATRPTARIQNPSNLSVFKLGEAPSLSGTARDERGVLAVQVEYWFLNQMVMKKNMACDGCGSTTAVWSDSPNLTTTGYYVAKVATYDLAGNRSDPQQVSFFTSGINSPVVTPGTPAVPQVPSVQTPEPGSILPGGGAPPTGVPVIIGGTTVPGTKVQVFETKEGDGWLGTTVGDSRTGRWTLKVKLDPGDYGIQARSVNSRGRASPLSAKLLFSIDGVRPTLSLEHETDPMIFAPTQPVVLSGRTGDDRHVVAVNLEYWLGDKLMLVENASCPACQSTRNAAWTDRPQLVHPGYYYVNVRAIDVAGNHSFVETIRFVKTI